MFYSHEVLTSRKYGVATIWLVATLGSKSTLKKVSRKAILDVDVVKACDTIVTPEAPMALRLQSNLLYGVTRVYAQQCGYVLSDAETARNNMKAIFKVMKAAALDAEGGHTARTDQIVLQDDPNFLPELDLLAMDIDTVDFAARADSQRLNSLLSAHSSQHSIGHSRDIGGLVIPQSASSFMGGPVGGIDGFSSRGDSGPGVRLASGYFQRRETEGVLEDDLGFMVDEDGNMFVEEERPYRQPRASSGVAAGVTVLGRAPSVHADIEQGDQGLIGQQDDNDFVMMQDDDYGLGQPADGHPARLQTEEEQQSTTSETAEAPLQRRPRAAHALALDPVTSLHNGDIARWSQQYLQKMKEATQHKQMAKLNAIAKKNAEHWMLGSSLETLGQAGRGPLDMFSGVKYLEMMTGVRFVPGGLKRAREEDGNDAFPSDRSKRSRGEPSSDEQGRGVDFHDDGYMAMGDDYTIEQGREQPTPLGDPRESVLSTRLPWNQSAGSRRPTNLFSAGATSGIGALPLGPLSRRGSRLTSASPLIGRGTVDDEGFQLLGSDGHLGLTGEEEFELFGPAAQVDTQTAAQSQWVRKALDGESANFLEFVKAGVEEQDLVREAAPPGDEEMEDADGSIEFETLLPPESNSRIVAAQGLLHVLTLGTRNALGIEQEEPFGPLRLRLIDV